MREKEKIRLFAEKIFISSFEIVIQWNPSKVDTV